MQPTYLPWAGYFNLIASVDCFIFLDDVQFARSSWQQKNRILVSGNEHVLKVPVKKAPLTSRLLAIETRVESNWASRHIEIMRSAYANAPFGPETVDFLASCYDELPQTLLARFNRQVIERIAGRLGLTPRFAVSSRVGRGGGRSERLANLCLTMGCNQYLSPPGAREYLQDDGFPGSHDIGLDFQDYQPRPYPQHYGNAFVSHLSIVDVVANIGWDEAARYVAKGANEKHD